MLKIGNGVLRLLSAIEGSIMLRRPAISGSPNAWLHSRRTHPLADHGAELRVAVELAQPDLFGGDEAEEENERIVLGSQRALLVQPLDC